MPDPHETPPEGEIVVTPLDGPPPTNPEAFGSAPSWYLYDLKYTGSKLSFSYVAGVADPYSASAWWVLWPFTMRDYAYYPGYPR